ncbi:MAG: hypothetical protein M3R57_11090 [Chloroflexota bacterium]|nr:hypothetical protein [Chloroflexota bacterium]
MSPSSSRRRPARTRPRWVILASAIALAGVAAGALLLTRPAGSVAQAAWTRFGTADVHSLAFAGGDPQHVLFGHHGGISESRDGGRTWSALPDRNDAMSLSAGTDGSIIVAGHDVFRASRDGGATWASIETDLPSLDIHGFTRDPADPRRMWAYLATGGLWESVDFGSQWTRVREDNVIYPVAVADGTGTRLLGVDGSGLVTSTDGGRTWATRGMPPTYPMTSLAAAGDGRLIYAGSPDGLFRSSDGGKTWAATGYRGSAFAVATSADGRVVAVVSRETDFFRSPDGGDSWPAPG